MLVERGMLRGTDVMDMSGARARGNRHQHASPPLAKGDPVLGISGLDPHILVFSTPENAPTEISLGFKKKSWKKKRS